MIPFNLPPDNRQGPSCGITALAVVSGASFTRVWNLVGAGKPTTWKGSVTDHDITRALRKLKVRYRSRPYGRSITVKQFAETKAKPGTVYILDVFDHIALLRDGVILDQRGRFTLEDKGHWKIEHLYEVRDV